MTHAFRNQTNHLQPTTLTQGRNTMTQRQAKILSDGDVRRLLDAVKHHRYALRDRVMILLSVKAGLRAGEIANLTWPMVMTATGRISPLIELHNDAAKNGSGRMIPMHPVLWAALECWRESYAELLADQENDWQGSVIVSERGDAGWQGMRASSVVTWFASLYHRQGLLGCCRD